MKVAFITSRYPSFDAPYNHMFVHMRVLEILKQNHQVKVFVPSKANSISIYEGVEVIRDTSKAIISKLNNFDICYLHLVNIYPFKKSNGWIIYKYLLNKKKPFALYIHGNEVQKYTSRFYEFNFSIREILKWIKKDFFVIPKMRSFVQKANKASQTTFIFPSKWMKEETERNLKVNLEKYKIVPNGINVNSFKYNNLSHNRYKLMTIRSLSQKVYDIEFSIKILKELPEMYTLDIYGKGIYEKNYKKLIYDLDLQNRVRIIRGFYNRDEMKDLFKKYGGYLSTTRMDSQGITMLEAMASGLVVAATDNSSRREFIDNSITGILGKTPENLAIKINTVFSDLNKYETMARNGRESVKKIDNHLMIVEEMNVLNQILIDTNK